MSTEHVEVALEPVPDPSVKGPGEDEVDVQTFLGRRNRIRVGAPRCDDYLDHLRLADLPVPADAQALVDGGYRLWRVRPTITLLPGPDCTFIAAEFSIELIGIPSATGETVARPIAYRVGPADIVDEDPFSHTRTTTREVGAEAGNTLAKVLAKVSQQDSINRDGVRHVRRQYSYGVNFSEVGWRLRATPDHELAGDIANLEVVVQVPPNVVLAGRFKVAAEIAVRATPDRWLTWAFVPRDGALETVYRLSP